MNNRLKQLTTSGQILFRDTDLAVLWNITNKNTLYTTIKRYAKSGVLEKMKQGIYSIGVSCSNYLDLLGVKVIHNYCYISTETVLRNEGIIQQNIPYITFVSSLSKRFTVKDQSYISRQLRDEYLYNKEGIYTKDRVNYATLERAVADLLYFNPKYYFDGGLRVDWKKVKEIQKIIGYNN
jgi:predicted transcriptional regulator of viral defense system